MDNELDKVIKYILTPIFMIIAILLYLLSKELRYVAIIGFSLGIFKIIIGVKYKGKKYRFDGIILCITAILVFLTGLFSFN